MLGSLNPSQNFSQRPIAGASMRYRGDLRDLYEGKDPVENQ